MVLSTNFLSNEFNWYDIINYISFGHVRVLVANFDNGMKNTFISNSVKKNPQVNRSIPQTLLVERIATKIGCHCGSGISWLIAK